MCIKNNNEQKEEVLTLKQVSRELKAGTHELRKWIKSGILRPIRLVGMHPYKFTREAINEFIDENTINQGKTP